MAQSKKPVVGRGISSLLSAAEEGLPIQTPEVQSSKDVVQTMKSEVLSSEDVYLSSSPEMQSSKDVVQPSEISLQTKKSEVQSSSPESQVIGSEVQRADVSPTTSEDVFQPSELSPPMEVSEVQNSKDERLSSDFDIHSPKAGIQSIDLEALEQAIQEGAKYPKVTAYSPFLAAVMRYFEITVTRYRISTEAAKMLEEDVKEAYPELWDEVQKRMQHKTRRRR